MKRSTYRTFLLSACLFLLSGLPGMTQVLLYDNFNYTAGTQMTANNWIQQQTTSTNPILVSGSGLTYPGYVCSGIGNAASLGTDGQDVFRGFTKQTIAGTKIYLAFLVKVTAAASGDCFISLKESPTSATNAIFRGRVYARTDASNNISFGISKGAITAPATANYTPAAYSLNTTYLLVMKYSLNEGADNDSAVLFVNPIIGNPEPAPNVICQDFTASEVGLGSILLRQGTAGSSPTVIVDGCRVATSWHTVLNVSNVATLNDLKVDGITVSGFSPEVYSYNDTVPSGQTSVVVASTPTDWAATQVVNTATSIPGTSTVVVTAENGTTTRTYSVTHAYNYFPVTVAAAPAGWGSVTGGGTYGQGFEATVTATPEPGYTFFNWTENGVPVSGSSVYTFTVTQPASLVANFLQIMYLANATPVPAAGGTVNGTGYFPAGSNVTLTAVPANGYILENWTENGTIVGTSPVYIITNLQTNHDLNANFIQSSNTFSITAVADPPNGGIVTGSGNFPAGSTDTLRATANVNFKFQKWLENGTTLGTEPELVLTNIQSNHTITAFFTSTVGMDEGISQGVALYPNPSRGAVHVSAGTNISLIEIFDLAGTKICINEPHAESILLSTAGWAPGIYMVKIITGGKSVTRKLVIAD